MLKKINRIEKLINSLRDEDYELDLSYIELQRLKDSLLKVEYFSEEKKLKSYIKTFRDCVNFCLEKPIKTKVVVFKDKKLIAFIFSLNKKIQETVLNNILSDISKKGKKIKVNKKIFSYDNDCFYFIGTDFNLDWSITCAFDDANFFKHESLFKNQ